MTNADELDDAVAQKLPEPFCSPANMDELDAKKLASGGSLCSGVVCAIGWYVFIDSLLRVQTECVRWGVNGTLPDGCDEHTSTLIAPPALVNGSYWLPVWFGTLGLISLNLISWDAVTGDGAFNDESVQFKARVWVLGSMVAIFVALGSAVVMKVAANQTPNGYTGAAAGCLWQAFLNFVAAGLFRYARRGGEGGEPV